MQKRRDLRIVLGAFNEESSSHIGWQTPRPDAGTRQSVHTHNSEEAARLLSVKTSWIYEAVRAGRVPCLRVGRQIRFTRHMLEDWLAEQTKL